MRQWFAPSHVFTHLPGFPLVCRGYLIADSRTFLAYAPDGSLMPNLATEVPTTANGGLSDDLSKVTLNLRQDVLWSDGEPLTAQDVVWTWQWITDESNGSWNREAWSQIQAAEAIGPTTVELTYANPSLAWFFPITGSYFGSIIPSHIWEGKEKAAVNADFAIEPDWHRTVQDRFICSGRSCRLLDQRAVSGAKQTLVRDRSLPGRRRQRRRRSGSTARW